MTTANKFPKLLTATRALRAVTARVFPKTAVKKRLAVNSLEVRICSLGTVKEASVFERIKGKRQPTGREIGDVCEEIEDEGDRE